MHALLEALGMRFDYTRELLMLGLILGRVMPMVFISPFLGGQQAPPETKMSIGVLFTVLIWPLAHDTLIDQIPIYALPFTLLLLKEILLGFCIGFANAHVFHGLEAAGRFIDTARGAAMGEVLVPSSNQRATAIGTLYSQLLLVFFVVVGGHHIFFELFFRSFAVIPIDQAMALTPGLSATAEHTIALCSKVLMLAVVLSAPAIAATFIVDLVFGILNRVAPQLNAYFLAMPVKAMGGLALMLVSLRPFLERVSVAVIDGLNAADTMVKSLAPR